GSLYTFTDLSLIDFNVFIEVNFAPNTNTKITIKHFHESVSGSFLSNADVIDSTRSGTSDTEYALTDADRKNKLGFIFDYATAEGSNVKINALNVEPDGSTTFCLYYKRKTIEVSYVDANYSSLNPIGSLPANKTVKFGVPFTLDKPTNYLIYGYTFKGYTDGVTYDGNALKIYGVIPYAITDATIDNIIFTIVMTPNTNTEYVVRRYLDGVEEILTYYGATGNHVTIENMNLLGYVRSPKNDEILSGTISGYVKDQSGAITAGSRLELKIYFESKLYDLTFSGTDGTANQQAKVGDTITLPDAPTAPEGYSFSGWLINGVTYSAGAEYVMPASQVTVTAVWSKITAPSTEQNAPEANQSTPSSNEKTSLGGGAIAGIVIGSVAFISIVIAVVFIIIKRNKQSNQ
ncbi:MAG: InlB B-repeat-containing protein, partial [Clostridia bacterium]|nr:InlB B-repeat-containing protein [Clostridia bacterium]